MSLTASPKLIKGGLVVLDAASGAVKRTIALQYNPDSLTRTMQVQGAGEGGDRSEAMRLTGPPVETIKLNAKIEGPIIRQDLFSIIFRGDNA